MDRCLREHQGSTTTAFGAVPKCAPRRHPPISHLRWQFLLGLFGCVGHARGGDGAGKEKSRMSPFLLFLHPG